RGTVTGLSAPPRGPLVSRFLFEPVSGRGDQGRTCPGQCPLVQRLARYGKGQGEVVQRREGLWLHRAGVGSGRVRPLHGDPGRWFPESCGGRYGRVRSRAGSQGLAGAERPQGLTQGSQLERARGCPPRARFVCGSYICAMTPIRTGLVALLVPAVAFAQATPAATYRGFAPGASYRDFVQ